MLVQQAVTILLFFTLAPDKSNTAGTPRNKEDLYLQFPYDKRKADIQPVLKSQLGMKSRIPGDPVKEQEPAGIHQTIRKRAVQNYPLKWDYRIPYVIDDSFTSLGVSSMWQFKRAIQYIMDRVCLTFVDETGRWNSSDPKWFSNNGYTSNNYIYVNQTSGCEVGGVSDLNGSKKVRVSPCTGFWINLHEMLHAIFVQHMQQGYLSQNYITINQDDILEKYLDTYDTILKESGLINLFFDPSSPVMYHIAEWNRNGNEAYTPIRDDLFNTITDSSNDDVDFMEVVQTFQCAQQFCGRNNVDCAPGYYSYVKGVCRCVCPDEYDFATNCKTLINGPSPTAKWPNTPMVVFAGGPSHSCPTGFDPTPGWFSFTGTNPISLNEAPPQLFPRNNNTSYVPVCTRNLPAGTTPDWESWPAGGVYCVIKSVNVTCGAGFVESGGVAQSYGIITTNGSIGDITVVKNNLTIKVCCRNQEPDKLPIDLPDDKPFRLLTGGDSCPIIKGMKAYFSRMSLWTDVSGEFSVNYHAFFSKSQQLITSLCYYQPAVYGCNQLVTLDANNRAVTIQTPTQANGVREPYRRCIYAFNAPNNSQILISFNKYQLHTRNDDFLVKRYHPWQAAYRLDNTKPPKQIISETNYLSAEAFIGSNNDTYFGVNFTAQVILPEDYCYDPTTNGADYRGKTAISETYEPCIEWSKAVNCSNFPKSDQMANILSGNQCRNPDGRRGPWCYTYINGTNCNIRYCDACNFLKPVDAITQCYTLMRNNLTFCTTGIQRFLCFVSCKFTVQNTTRAVCGPPTIPTDGQVVGSLKASYKEGEKVRVTCALNNNNGLANDMYCTATGWTTLYQACQDICVDKVDTCESVMAKSPTFCLNPNTIDTAKSSCSLSCGFCSSVVSTCSTPTSTTYTRTSALATIKPGQVMTFTCNAGQYYVSGDLSRACSMSGNLLGTEPVCQSTPVATDVNLNSVRKRMEALPASRVVILDKDGYRIPFNGNISTWYYYCQMSGNVYFTVYRKNGTLYSLVGFNKVSCQAGIKWGEDIPASSQISVLKGDIIGAFTLNVNTLSMNNCTKDDDKIMNVPIATNVNAENKLQSAKFNFIYCYILSLGCRVQPV